MKGRLLFISLIVFMVSFFAKGSIWRSYVTEKGYLKAFSSAFDIRGENLYFANSGGGFSIFNGQSLKKFHREPGKLLSEKITAIKAGEDIIWIGTDIGLCAWDGKEKWEYFTTKKGLLNNSITAIEIDQTSRVVVAHANGLSIGLRKAGMEWIKVEPWKGKFFKPEIQTAKVDPKGNIWIGTDQGLWVWDSRNWHNFTTKNGLLSNMVKDIEFDDNGSLYVCGYDFFGGGISKWDGNEWTRFTLKERKIHDLSVNSGIIWAATDTGLYKFAAGNWQRYTQDDGVATEKITSVKTRSGEIYFRGFNKEMAIVGELNKRIFN